MNGTSDPADEPWQGSVCAAAGAVLVGVSLGLHWFTADVATKHSDRLGIHLPVVRWVILVLVAVLFFSAVAQLAPRPRATLYPLTVASAILLLALTGILLLGVETASALVPRHLLPVTTRRVSFQLAAGAGLWLAVAGSGIALVGATPALWGLVRRVSLTPLSGAVAALAALTGVLAWERAQPWVTLDAPQTHLSVPGRELPWIGPFTMLLAIGLVGAVVACFLTSRLELLFVIVLLAWMFSLLTAIVGLAGVGIARLRISTHGATVHGGTNPWLWVGFAVALVIALLAVATLTLSTRDEAAS